MERYAASRGASGPSEYTAAIERADGTAWVSTVRGPDHAASGGGPAISPGFADDLPDYARALRRAPGRAPVRAFALISHRIRTAAEAFGLRGLHSAVVDAVRDVRRTRDLAASRPAIEALARACERVAQGRRSSAA